MSNEPLTPPSGCPISAFTEHGGCIWPKCKCYISSGKQSGKTHATLTKLDQVKVQFTDGSIKFMGSLEEAADAFRRLASQLWKSRLTEVFGNTDPKITEYKDDDQGHTHK